jgi:hypothetical protein
LTDTPSASTPWKDTIEAARANLLPGLALQVFALSIVLAYYFHPATHASLDVLAEFKSRLGVSYSLVATALCGGIIPSLYLWINPRTRAVTPLSHVLFFTIFWAYKGVEVDYMYRFQGWMFGTEPTFWVIVKKVLADEIVFTGLWSAPSALFVFHWKESGFLFSSIRDLNAVTFLKQNLPKALLATWVVWFPAVAIIYSLPSALQMPLFNIVLCFFSLLYITLTRKNKTSTPK